jgi:hypothetical protein
MGDNFAGEAKGKRATKGPAGSRSRSERIPSERGRMAPDEHPVPPDDRQVFSREERGPRPQPASLRDPRDPAWEDNLGAKRRFLSTRKDVAARFAGPPEQFEPPLALIADAVYRYSKSIDFTNDEMGYGEVIEEEFWQVERDGRVSSRQRRSQRTKTGRQFLEWREREVVQQKANARPDDQTQELPEQALQPRKRAP